MSDDEDYMEDSEEYVSDEEEDDEVFEAPAVTAQESFFNVLTAEECDVQAKKAVQEVVELLCCEPHHAQLLLRRYKWDREALTEAYMTDPDAVAKKAGVAINLDDNSIVHRTSDSKVLVGGTARSPSTMAPVQCQICFESSSSYSALACGHPFCNNCYAEFLSHQIADQGHECYFARCPEPKCGLVVTPQLVHSLVRAEEPLRRYEKAASLARSFVDDQPGLKWCPAPDCGLAVRGKPGVLSVKCACTHRFCFQCNQDDHQPASCENLAKWMVKCRDDSETYNWLVANTKPCPKCQTSIEKNGGCNHMTCKNTSCKYEFCWVCSGPWKEHSGSYYNCNKFDPEKDKDTADGKKKDSSRAALERYLHYYTRFTNHHNSLKFEIEAKTKMENKIKEMEALGDNTWMDCLYLNEANEALYECRYALKFTYVFAFYLSKESNFRHHFEMQQTELERQTEELAELLEKPVDEIQRMVVVHCFQMAKKRLRNLMELVEAESSQWRAEQEGGAGSSSSGAGSSSDPVVA